MDQINENRRLSFENGQNSDYQIKEVVKEKDGHEICQEETLTVE